MNSALQAAARTESQMHRFSDTPTVNDLITVISVPHPRFGLERPERARRFLNVVVAMVALIVCAPLMLAIALLVALTSRGPILYTQTRVGVNRRTA